jgi:hypothetical protein
LSRRARLALLVLANAVGLLAVAWNLGADEVLRTAWYRASPDRPAVVFVVMDTVRADRLSACGHDRPTSPTLEALVAQGATLRCDAVAPGSWTIPSHASFFTGLPVQDHGAHFTGSGEDIAGLVIRPLPDGVPTLADQMAAAGYQTTAVSGNKVVRAESGLDRGFSSFRAAPWGSWWRGDSLLDPLRDALRELDDDDGPLFLFVNIFDAHDPWSAVPEGHPWLPARPGSLLFFAFHPGTEQIDPDGPWQRYVQGRMSAEEAAALREDVTDRYDLGVWKADRTLGRVIDTVRAHGWADAGMRLVVTSDHGEFLGEQGLLRHGRYLWEGNQQVPLLVLDDAGPVDLPAQPSGLVVPALVRDGRVPDEPPQAQAVAFPDQLWWAQSGHRLGGSTSAALWDGPDKVVWMDGVSFRVARSQEADLAARRPLLPTDPLAGPLATLADAAQASGSRDLAVAPEMLELLQAAGYLEAPP